MIVLLRRLLASVLGGKPWGGPSPVDQASESASFKKRGNQMLASGKLDDAAACYRQAILIDPNSAEAHLNLGYVLQQQQRYSEARLHLEKAVLMEPGNADASYVLGSVLLEQDDLEGAIASFDLALAKRPDLEPVYADLCRALFLCGRIESSRKVILQGLALYPNNGNLHCFHGNLYAHEGQSDQAIACFLHALSLAPDYVEAQTNLAKEYQKLDRFAEAESCYRKVLSSRPQDVESWNNLGLVATNIGNLDEAKACFEQALTLDADHVLALNNLATLFQGRGNLDEALACYRKVLAINPGYAVAQNNLGALHQLRGEVNEAVACYRRALDLEPGYHGSRMNLAHQLQWQCDWAELESQGEILRQAVREGVPGTDNLISPFSFLALPGTTPLEQKLCGSQWAQGRYRAEIALQGRIQFQFRRDSRTPIHIGYLSADFHDHATARLMAEVLELHDRDRFRVSAYSYGPDDGSVMRKRLERAVARFVEIGRYGDEAAARVINDDAVDILVDLKGYTDGSRSSILALRPAPIQVNYLGYPGTMGAPFVDCLIADRFIIPAEQQHCYTERVVWLPECYQPNDRTRPRLPAPSRKDCGLPGDGVVFCCFNQTYKITAQVFDVWCRLLAAVPGSVLWLLASNHVAVTNLHREARQRGIEPARLVMAPYLRQEKHLARLQCADLFLDTVPVNAHTTCSDALWMGLPVVTSVGDTFASRVAGSLLAAMGTPELIASNLDAYYALAFDLAANGGKRDEIRRRIAANRDSAPLFDSKRFARDLDALYAQMWAEYLQH